VRYLGVDWGEKRIGLAAADEVGVAVPLPAATGPRKKQRLKRIADEIDARGIEAIVVGYPLNMDGSAGFQTRAVDGFIAELERRFGLPVHRADERLSSRAAESAMRGASRRQKPDRTSGALDSSAAALILQDFLEERGGGRDRHAAR